MFVCLFAVCWFVISTISVVVVTGCQYDVSTCIVCLLLLVLAIITVSLLLLMVV